MTHARPGRDAVLAEAIDAISALTRDLAAAGTYPFRDRRLGRAQMNLLYQVSRSAGIGVGALAAALDVTSGAVSQHVDALRVAGLVTVDVDPADARARIVALTDVAREEVDAFQQDWIAAVAPRFDDLSDDEVGELRRLLSLVRPAVRAAR
ncbi:MarR family winged helix-turn-helix transcriptional regulator [Arthrobacter bussei]|jgi:DNA-binding MarR family transcriptional regulator|uniref:Winged helix-turn-helix transcriptional regulator n=1 Tax=Arthrobacter bussei TaxID=2594179 RepID=A0A7X1NMK3_9MICC|nr:MarR family winged helix-turn-helix transcriptional regulator [Arthrobacter bussei]MPY09599.1 winged helix-turn-helix transcriptional regulator [Arthrobacter bussei]